MPTYAVIWIDHQESRIFHVHPATTTDTLLLTLQHEIQRQPNVSSRAPEQPYRMHRFFADIARVLDGVDGILLVGPSSTKLEFFRYVYQHERRLEQRVVGIESADHPADAQVMAGARSYFGATDPLTIT
jgi:stalled ribosome rescue protein Dom34